jgi:glycosyltransferase involved in cell wall biosynthesis
MGEAVADCIVAGRKRGSGDSMKITFVTPTLNSERFFAETLASIHTDIPDSVLVQHVVVDGGSSDRTVPLAREYGCELVVGEDQGLYDAMNIGIRRAEGDVIAILNSDDTLLEGAIAAVAAWYGDRSRSWAVGGLRWTDASGRRIADLPAPPTWLRAEVFASLGWNCIHHQATFMTRECYSRVGEYDLEYPLAADYELLARALRLEPFDRIDRTLSTFRRHGQNASMRGERALIDEGRRIASEYGPSSDLRKAAYRAGLKAWLNASNPGWFLAKKRGPS